jgi:phage terminase large subunit-like protein
VGEYVEKGLQYARDVVDRKIVACKWTILACERQLRDLERWHGQEDAPYRFDVERAEHICRFIELLPHIKGKWAKESQRIKLEPWQCFELTTVFGWLKPDGNRRFRTVYEEVARKNAKSTKSSGVGLYMLTADGEQGAEVYSAATTRDQAKIVFSDGKAMAVREEGFRRRYGVDVKSHNVNVPATASKFEALSAEDSSLDGLNIHCAIVDELHAHKTRAVFDVLETATGSRTQSLLWLITTAGSNRAGICYEQRTYATKILERVIEDETYWVIIYTIDDGDDWTSEEAWRKANPNYGVSVLPDDIARLCKKAQELPSAQNNFLTKRLNVWVNADTAWMDMRAWDKCADHSIKLEQFTGRPCYIGVDLASTNDIASIGLWFPPDGDDDRHTVFTKNYLPEMAIEEGRNSQYSGWERAGHLIATHGNATDIEQIKDDLLALCTEFQVKRIGVDPYQTVQFEQDLIKGGISPELVLKYGATVVNFSAPMKDIEVKALTGKIRHDGSPVLTWAMSNVVAHTDKKDNIFPNKERYENKIDPVVTLIMANGLRMREPQAEPSVYANPETAVM